MHTLEVKNVHLALPQAINLLKTKGIERGSRNGKVLQVMGGVATVYQNPCERVLFWPERDANPFFHLYESLWMLSGRNDIAPLVRYVKQMQAYSDDGVTQYAAYGHRWRTAFRKGISTMDQLAIIADRLKKDPEDRRCMLQMWNAETDLGHLGKDVPCNTMTTFQRDENGKLDITVFCRSNDIVWGAYGANAVQFSMLLEYMALWIGCPVGKYTQVSVNWHGYLDTLQKFEGVHLRAQVEGVKDPYIGKVHHEQMFHCGIEQADARISSVLFAADSGFQHRYRYGDDEPFFDATYKVLRSHHIYQTTNGKKAERIEAALDALSTADETVDWVVAAREWFERRRS